MFKFKSLGVLASALLLATTVTAQPGNVTRQVEQNYGQQQGAYGSSYMGGGMTMDMYAAYTTLNMKKVNAALAEFQTDVLEFFSYDDSLRFTKLGSGFSAGATLNFELSPGLKIGPHLGIIYAFPGELEGIRDNSSWAYDYTWTNTYTSMMIPVAASISYSPPLPNSNLNLTLGAQAGIGFVTANWNSEYDTDNPNWAVDLYNYDIPVSGSGTYVNFFVNLDFPMGPTSSFFLRAGYRMAKVKEVTADTRVTNAFPFGDINEGEVAEDIDGNPVEIDYTGIELGLGMSFVF